MNPTTFAMRRPVTTMMMVVALISGGALAFQRMRVDIFPPLNTPKIYVFLDYIGMSPDQIEGFIVNQLELYFQYVDGIREIDSRNIQQVALCQLSFFPGTDMGQAMAQVVAMSGRAMSWMPKGTLPPMIMRMDSGSVPVGYLVFESKTTSLGALGDLAQNIIRPLVQKFVPGTVAISPFGPNMRSIVINVDPHKLRDYNVGPQEVIDALATGNRIIPAGNIYVKDSMPVVANNATVVDVQRLGEIPLKVGYNVYLRDVATIQDDTDITYGYALVRGKKSVYLPIIKKDTGSTLTVVADVHKSMQLFRDAVPKDVTVNFEFDESPTVVAAVESVATEGLIGAGLTGLMILLFLRDLRSVIVVVTTIPLSLLGSLCGLWMTGNTINIMSLGGMALAIGILVDMATVTIENMHVQMGRTPKIATAVLRGNQATAVPILLALLCILSVFVPAFIMQDPLRSLFMPLTLAVGFAMIVAYLLASTFVPILCVALLRHHKTHGDGRPGLFERMLGVYRKVVGFLVRQRVAVVLAYLGACGLVLWVLGFQVGTELFPQIDSGQFVLRFRPPPGSNFELTRQMAVKCLEEIEHEASPENIAITMGYVGQVAPNFGIDNMVLFMRGPDDGQLRVAFREGAPIRLAEFRERLRKVLPERVIPWLKNRLEQGGLSPLEADGQSKLATFGFEPGDIVTKVMSFGSLTPIAVRVVGTDLKVVREHATKIAGMMKRIPFLRDVQFEQTLDYPTVEVNIDREKAGLSGAKVDDVAHALVMATAFDSFRQSQLLGRYTDRLRLSGADPDAAPQNGEGGRRRDFAAPASQSPRQLDGPGCGDRQCSVRPGEFDRSTSQRVPDRNRQCRRRRHGPRLEASPSGDRRRRRVASRRAGRAHGPAPADDRDVPGARDRLGGGRIRDFRPSDSLFPIAADGAGLGGCRSGCHGGYRDHSLFHEHFAQHRIVHGLDHVAGRLGFQLGAACDFHERVLEGGRTLSRSSDCWRRRPSAADLDDCGRDDSRHGADGAGARTREPDAGAARSRGDRRAGDVDVRDVAGVALDLRTRGGPQSRPLTVDLSGRSPKSAFRPARLRRARGPRRWCRLGGPVRPGSRGIGRRQ